MGLRQLGIEGFGSNPKAKEWERDGYYKSLYNDDDEDDDDDPQEEGDNNDYTDDDEEEDE